MNEQGIESKVRLLTSALCLLVAVVGCDSRPPLAPVKGQVTIKGEPLPGGRIMFEPLAEGPDKLIGKQAFGDIAEDGTFVLSTYEDGDGALVGKHHPVVFGQREEDPARATRKGPNIGLIRLTRLTLEVKPGQENEFTIDIVPADLRFEAVEDD